MGVVAVLAAVGTSFGFMQLVNEALRSQMCYDLDEALVIMLCSMLSAGLAIVIILQYIKRHHPKHVSPLAGGPPKAVDNDVKEMVVIPDLPDHYRAGDPIEQHDLTIHGSA